MLNKTLMKIIRSLIKILDGGIDNTITDGKKITIANLTLIYITFYFYFRVERKTKLKSVKISRVYFNSTLKCTCSKGRMINYWALVNYWTTCIYIRNPRTNLRKISIQI